MVDVNTNHRQMQKRLIMTYSWTRIVIQNFCHIFDCKSLVLAVLGTEILLFYLECFDMANS